ncbi:MAG: hypothetical protein Pars92KO_27800 [Parasphingorhabdus sp.]
MIDKQQGTYYPAVHAYDFWLGRFGRPVHGLPARGTIFNFCPWDRYAGRRREKTDPDCFTAATG